MGFIPAHVSHGGDLSGLAFKMDRGQKYQCRIRDLTAEPKNLGVKIKVTEREELHNVGWLFAAAAVLLFGVAIIIQLWS